jgi:REP element-mobilizing transposase RayT
LTTGNLTYTVRLVNGTVFGRSVMARVNRREVLSDGEIQVVHCINRCVRRGFLCGVDELTGKNYEHRRQWMRNRLEFLAGIFAVDIIGFSVMSNHLHVILRNRPDVVTAWSDEEVAKRWWHLFPQRRNKDGSPADPADTDLNHLITNIKELRQRLSSISWFMRCTSEVIARMANAEDECTGRFWEGRFKATLLPDEAAITACMVYVDLNPIRAGIAKTPEQSDFTSVQERMADLKAAESPSSGLTATFSPVGEKGQVRGKAAWAKGLSRYQYDHKIEHGQRAGWLAPVELEPKRKKVREKCSSRRASNRGCVFLSLSEYLQLLDWTGRQLRLGKRGSIPKSLLPILDRLDLSPDVWLHAVEQFGKRRAANRATPASRFNAAGQLTTVPVDSQRA